MLSQTFLSRALSMQGRVYDLKLLCSFVIRRHQEGVRDGDRRAVAVRAEQARGQVPGAVPLQRCAQDQPQGTPPRRTRAENSGQCWDALDRKRRPKPTPKQV